MDAAGVTPVTESVAEGGGPLGALVVRDGEVVATGTNRVTTALDRGAHAEVCAPRGRSWAAPRRRAVR
ncbi:hypothetical protein [Streptomyces sp. NPDC056628]|uniref:hypothetical protein n=1 Tax=Streptomyces sp. NPDC056628 TaxID=3345882 RepID=UPI00368CB167